jgi:hypothetical protein
MEGMRVRVQSIDVHEVCVHAVIIAVRFQRFFGQTLASLKLRLRLEMVEGESVKLRFRRVRDEALRYLDID